MTGFIFFCVALLAIGGWVAVRLRHWFATRTMKRRFAIGAKAEVDAVKLLERHGYTVRDGQVGASKTFLVDGKPVSYHVRADYLADKDGQVFVVEVKSGNTAPNPKHPATRRQLLEYQHVYQTDGLILADMREGVLLRVDFELDGVERQVPTISLRALVLAGGVGLVVGLLW
jgi:Holliday junction resolvase